MHKLRRSAEMRFVKAIKTAPEQGAVFFVAICLGTCKKFLLVQAFAAYIYIKKAEERRKHAH
ncbi:hypothetical protein Bbad01_11490 [Bacillus badius]|nr:hypothetical protein Bbad01_11490 [Bacillus badius]